MAVRLVPLAVPGRALHEVWNSSSHVEHGGVESLVLYRPQPLDGVFFSVGDTFTSRSSVVRFFSGPSTPPVLLLGEVAAEVVGKHQQRREIALPPEMPRLGPAWFMRPLNFKRIWAAKKGISLWAPMAPPGYVALGCVFGAGREMPPLESVMCVHVSLAAPAKVVAEAHGGPLWRDAVCSPGVTLWRLQPLDEREPAVACGTFWAFAGSGHESDPAELQRSLAVAAIASSSSSSVSMSASSAAGVQTQLYCLATAVQSAHAPLLEQLAASAALAALVPSGHSSTAPLAVAASPGATLSVPGGERVSGISPSPARPYQWLSEANKLLAQQEKAELLAALAPGLGLEELAAHQAPPPSPQSASTLDGSAAFASPRPAHPDSYPWPYRWLGRRSKLLSLFHDEAYQSFVRWFEAHPSLASIKIPVNELAPVKAWLAELTFRNAAGVNSPLRVIRENCQKAAASLERGEVILSVYGTLNAGKSTLCNLLLGSSLLYVANAQCTALPCVIRSGESAGSARVFFEKGIDPVAVMSEIEERNHSLKQNTSWNTCRDTISHLYSLQQRSHEHNFAVLTDHEQLQTLSRLPASLRNIKLLSGLEAIHPVLGLRQQGVALVDCPGLQENVFLDSIAEKNAQRASVILFVINTKILSGSDKKFPIDFLMRQRMNGAEIFFIFNIHSDNDKQSLEDCFSTLLEETKDVPEFHDLKIYCVNCKVALEDNLSPAGVQRFESWLHSQPLPAVAQERHGATEEFVLEEHGLAPLSYVFSSSGNEALRSRLVLGFENLRRDLISCIEQRSKGLLLHFASTYYQILHTQYLLLSRLITLTMSKRAAEPAGGAPPARAKNLLTRRKRFDDRSAEALQRFRTSFAETLTKANGILKNYQDELKALFLRITEQEKGSIQTTISNTTTVNPEPEPGGAFLMFRTSPEMLEFKQELFDLAVSRFMGKFSMKYVDWLCEKKRSYLSELVALAAGIERQNSFRELKADLTEDSLTLKMHDLFRTTEKSLDEYAFQVAAPIVTGAILGGAGIGSTLLLGALGTALLAGSAVVLTGVAVAGVAAGLYITAPTNTRDLVYQEVWNSLTSFPRSNEFEASISWPAVRILVEVRDYIISSLYISLLEVESLSNVQGSAISYDELCECIYHREDISDRLSELSNLLVQWQDEHASATSSSSRQSGRSSDSATLPTWISRLQEKWRAADSCIAWNFHRSNDEQSRQQFLLKPTLPQCFACRRRFVACSHLCPSCRESLNDMEYGDGCKAPPCPACNKWNYFAQNDHELKEIVGKLTQIVTTTRGRTNSMSSTTLLEQERPIDSNSNELIEPIAFPKIIIQELQEKYLPVVNNFVEWFNSTNTPGNVDLSTASAAVYKFIGAFMSVLSEYPLADEHHRVISNWLLSVLVPRIYHSWFELYCTTANYQRNDELLYRGMQGAAKLGILPSYFFRDATTVLDGHVSELDEAAALMKTIEAKVLPEEKLRCITDAIEVISRTYEKAAANHRVNSELLVPIVTYVTIRSKIRTLYSQMMFIEDATTEGNGAMGISLFGKEDFIKNTWEMAVEDLLARCVSNAFVATSDDSSDDEQPLDDSEGDSDVKAPADSSTRPVSALSLSLELDRRQRAPQ